MRISDWSSGVCSSDLRMINKRIDSWVIWIVVDAIATDVGGFLVGRSRRAGCSRLGRLGRRGFACGGRADEHGAGADQKAAPPVTVLLSIGIPTDAGLPAKILRSHRGPRNRCVRKR